MNVEEWKLNGNTLREQGNVNSPWSFWSTILGGNIFSIQWINWFIYLVTVEFHTPVYYCTAPVTCLAQTKCTMCSNHVKYSLTVVNNNRKWTEVSSTWLHSISPQSEKKNSEPCVETKWLTPYSTAVKESVCGEKVCGRACANVCECVSVHVLYVMHINNICIFMLYFFGLWSKTANSVVGKCRLLVCRKGVLTMTLSTNV